MSIRVLALRLLGSAEIMRSGLRPRLTFLKMVGERLGKCHMAIRVERFEYFSNASMQFAAPIAQQTDVCDLVGESVLEGVFKLGEQTRFIEEFCCLEIQESLSELILRHGSDCLQDGMRHIVPDDRG